MKVIFLYSLAHSKRFLFIICVRRVFLAGWWSIRFSLANRLWTVLLETFILPSLTSLVYDPQTFFYFVGTRPLFHGRREVWLSFFCRISHYDWLPRVGSVKFCLDSVNHWLGNTRDCCYLSLGMRGDVSVDLPILKKIKMCLIKVNWNIESS